MLHQPIETTALVGKVKSDQIPMFAWLIGKANEGRQAMTTFREVEAI
jgi:hypothetical protein